MRRAVEVRHRGTPTELDARLRLFDLHGALEVVRSYLDVDGDITAERLYDLFLWQNDPSRFQRIAERLRATTWRRRGRKAPPLRPKHGPLE